MRVYESKLSKTKPNKMLNKYHTYEYVYPLKKNNNNEQEVSFIFK